MLRKLLVPTDGSDISIAGALRALRHAMKDAEGIHVITVQVKTNTPVLLLHVTQEDIDKVQFEHGQSMHRGCVFDFQLRQRDAMTLVLRLPAKSSESADAMRRCGSALRGFAGRQETYLNVQGMVALLETCKRCFASLFTDCAISYRVDKGFEHFKVALSIGVQRSVTPDEYTVFKTTLKSGYRPQWTWSGPRTATPESSSSCRRNRRPFTRARTPMCWKPIGSASAAPCSPAGTVLAKGSRRGGCVSSSATARNPHLASNPHHELA